MGQHVPTERCGRVGCSSHFPAPALATATPGWYSFFSERRFCERNYGGGKRHEPLERSGGRSFFGFVSNVSGEESRGIARRHRRLSALQALGGPDASGFWRWQSSSEVDVCWGRAGPGRRSARRTICRPGRTTAHGYHYQGEGPKTGRCEHLQL